MRIEPVNGPVLIFAISAGDVEEMPTRWRARRKCTLELPEGEQVDLTLSHHGTEGLLMEEIAGGYRHVKMDLGQIISVKPRIVYDNEAWNGSGPGIAPEVSAQELVVEYTSHPDAHFHLAGGATVPVRQLEANGAAEALRAVSPADIRVRFSAIEKDSRLPVAVRLHVHGEAGEYLPPMNHHRTLNGGFFADYSVDYINGKSHYCSYIDGRTELLLPRGKVFVEVTKGFEVAPVRRVYDVGAETKEIVIELEHVLDWRSKGWVTADTHVHFLSPQTAILEGAAEGVNVINLLASQWGELFTNMGDFDGKTTWGSKETGGDGEHLVRVGTGEPPGPAGAYFAAGLRR